MTEIDCHPALVGRSRTGREHPGEKCVHQLFEEQVERTPEAVAVVFAGESLTYEELNLRANQLAHRLRSLGAGPESRVALYLERSLAMVVAICGTLKAGAAYVPIEPGHPADRVAFMLADANAAVVLTQKAIREELPPTPATVICLDDDDWPPTAVTAQPGTNPANQSTAADLAYVIFTSGSTGQPKGALITHSNIVGLMQATADLFRFNAEDVWTMFHSYAFDFSVWEIWGALLFGGRLVVVPYFVACSPRAFYELLKAERVTVLNQTPSAFHQLIQAESTDDAPGELELRYVVLGGEALAMASLKPWFERHGDEQPHVVNMYGITETTVHVTYRRLRKTDLQAGSVIGLPIPGWEIYILDAHLQSAPIGVPGELYVGGAGLARGYLNRPELTAERFIPNPFSKDSSARLYRTGDRARFLSECDIEYLGRIDRQVKIRGYRIELGEIEAVLSGHPDVSTCAVVTQNSAGGDWTLAAFVVSRQRADPFIESLRQWLGEKLPGYMIPSHFFVLPSLPLTANGKVDRKALEGMGGVELTSGTAYMAPRNERERTLVEIWQKALRRDRVGIRDNFFDLGGHSLLAVAISSQIALRLDVEDALIWMYEHPTIEQLAKQMESLAGEPHDTGSIEKADRHQPLPMSFGQQGMWLLQRTLPDLAIYNHSVAFRLSGWVDRERVRRSLLAIVERHEVLRTGLVQEGERLLQQVSAAKDIPLPWLEIDLRAVPTSQQPFVWEERLLEAARQPFDLARAPLWRAVWIQLTGEEQVLGITFHHSIVDEWTLRLFFAEWERLYAADGRSELAGLPELPVQFADFAAWERRRLSGKRLERQRRYWSEQLQNLPSALVLPTDMARPVRLSGRGAVHRFQIQGRVVTRLRALAHEEKTTLFTVVLAAFHVWLHRFTGQTDMVVGAPVANRARPEIQSLLGYFLNTLPLRLRVDGSASFRQVLRQERETLLGALSHTELPFEQMVEMAVKGRSLGHQPLFQVMFVFLEAGLPELKLDQAEVHPLQVSTRTSKCDLTLSVQAAHESLECRFEYPTDLFGAETAGRMAGHLSELLRAITKDPEKPICRLDLMPDVERQRALVAWNQTERAYPRDQCVHHLFEEQVERTPQAVAVEFKGERLTYAELNRRANQVAHLLRSLGAGPDVPVALALDRSLDLAIGLLGILKAGSGYVPLDLGYPPERLQFVFEDCGCRLLVTSRSVLEGLTLPPVHRVILDELPPGQLEENPRGSARPESLAYLMYTSGSTGQPKGVAMEHRPLMNLVGWQLGQSGSAQRTLQFASTSFDVSFQEVFSTWLSGGELVLVPQEARSDPARLWDLIVERRVERLFLPVVLLEHIAGVSERSAAAAPGLQEVITAGEQLRITPAIRSFFKRHFATTLSNQYGPTETHVVTCYRLPPDVDAWPALPPIGRPIANVRAYVLDAHLQPRPIGVPGELFLGGEQVARGYWGRPERTAEKFIPDPFSTDSRARLYRSGDRCRWLPDGNLDFQGRLDNQVKIRGYRVELGEIEAVLSGHPDLAESVVVTQNQGGEDLALAAFVVGRDSADLSVGSLRQWLKKKLPEYMVPARFFLLPALPLTPNGKIDRRALEKLGGVALTSGTDYLPPRNERERTLVEIWQAALHRDRVGIQDNFFDLGGHSLLAVVIGSQIALRLEVEFPLSWMFEHPTIAALAQQMESLVGDSRNLIFIEKVDRHQPLPMSFGQQGMWLLQQTLPDLATYNQSVAFRLSGWVDRERVRRSLRAIAERHEVLRTALVQCGDNLLQQVSAAQDIPLPWLEIDLRGEPPSQQPSALEEHLRVSARRPFDLARAPLWRALWIQLAAEEQVLGITFHHSIMDEWTLRLFLAEWERLYAADGRAELAGLPELPVQFADFAAWERQRLSGQRLEGQRRYWREQLQNLPSALELPTDMARPVRLSGRGAVHRFLLQGPVVTRLRALAHEEKTTLFTVMLAAFHVWLHRFTGQTDVVVGTPVADRSRPEIQCLLGFFLRTLPIRVRMDGSPNFRQVLRQLRETLLGAFSHADLPFEQMVEMAVKERASGQHPLFQVMFSFLGEDLPGLRLDQVKVQPLPVGTQTSKCDLTLSVQAAHESLDCRFEYPTDLFRAATAERMARHLSELLRSITEDPEKAIRQLDLMPEAERQQVLIEWNQTERNYPPDKCIHQLFEEQVERAPEAVAVVFEANSLTYRELNARANQLACHLRSLGVGPDVLVGLCAERSLEMFVALLGILKAGGAYVPIDPKYPKERIEFILQDTEAPILVTQRSLDLGYGGARRVYLGEAIPQCAASPADVPPTPSTLAYVIYTSGSTGKPKGVAIEHHSPVSFLHWVRDSFSDAELSGVLASTSICFDLSVFEIFGPLSWGGRVLLVNSVLDFWSVSGPLNATLINTVPSVLAELLRGGRLPASVLTLNLAGEPLRQTLVDAVFKNTSAQHVNDLYGPSETTTYSTWARRTLGGDETIGRPIARTQIYILDDHGQPLPAGIPGELYIGGAGVARGYWRRPELTAERFLPLRFSGGSGGRLFKTGDRARWREDGQIEFLGRGDNQIKIRGYRVELGEIESVLQKVPGVRECVVVATEVNPGEKRLAAYWVPADPPGAPSAGQLREFLKRDLPEYMVPAVFVLLQKLPLTANGKVDRRTLPPIEAGTLLSSEENVAPRTPLEVRLAKIWSEVLGVERVGIHDNFFALGGHSLAAARLVSRLNQQFDLSVPIAALFQALTIADLAEQIARSRADVPIKSQGIPRAKPLDLLAPEFPCAYLASFSQLRFWLLDQTETNRSAYNLPAIWRLYGGLHVEALQAALNQLLLRHDVLRTSLHFHGTELLQAVHATAGVELVHLPLPANSGPADVDALIQAEISRVFDLAQPPLLRARLIQRQPEDHILIITLHHSISDGWSQGVLHRELSVFYNAACRGEIASLPPLPLQFADFATWQHRHLTGPRFQELIAYWRSQLDQLPTLELPTDHPRPAASTYQGGHRRFALDPGLTAGLQKLCQQQEVTLHMGLLAWVATLLNRYSGQDDFAIGVLNWGRVHPDLESLMGVFINSLVIRTSFQETPSFLTLLDRVRAVSLAAYDHQDLPFEHLAESLQPGRDHRRNPLFRVLLQYIDMPEAQLGFEGVQSERLTQGWSGGILDLNFQFRLRDNTVHADLAYSTDLFSNEGVQRLVNDLQALLKSLLENPRAPVAIHPLSTTTEPPESGLFSLTSAQRDIWFEQMLYPGTPVYNIAPYQRIRAPLDRNIFARALTQLVQETDVLRMKLTERNSVPFQSFPEMKGVEMDFCDCSREADPYQSALSAMQRSACRPFHLTAEPLFRFALYQLSDDCYLWSQTYHHLVVDGWGCSLLVQRQAALYNAFLRGEPPPERPGTSYREFIQADAAYFSSLHFGRHRQYWQQKFATLPEPLFRPRHTPSGDEIIPGGIHTWWLPQELHRRLEAMAQAHAASVFHAWVALLYVYVTRTREREECVIRLPVLNRSGPAFKSTAGLFASVIPARFAFDPDQSFVSLMQGVAKNLREIYRNQQFPISEINHLARVFKTDRKRLFEISMSYENMDYAASFGSGGPCEPFMLTHRHEQTPLAIFVRDYSSNQALQVDFTFNQAYFELGEIERMQRHLASLFESALTDPEQSIARLVLLPADERHQLLYTWNRADEPRPQASIPALFAEQVAQCPDAPAVLFGHEVLRYGELNARANQLAHALRSLGLEREGLVALALERSPDMIVALLGILKAGGAYIPLDPGYPADRLTLMLEDSGARILITRQSLRGRFANSSAQIFCLDAEQTCLSRQSLTDPRTVVEPEQLAYVLFTSGSTGVPKGVMIEHRNVVRLVRSEGCLQFGRDEVFLQLAPLSFDASTLEIWAPLLNGGRLVLMPPGQPSLEAIATALRAHAVTTLWLTAGLFHLMVDERLEDLVGLRRLFAGGDVLSVPHVKKAVAALVRRPGPKPCKTTGLKTAQFS